MRRKTILVGLFLALVLARSHLAEAQQPKKIFRIGFLASGGEPNLRGWRQGLRELGYVEGKNITIEYRFSGGEFDRFPALAEGIRRSLRKLGYVEGQNIAFEFRHTESTRAWP